MCGLPACSGGLGSLRSVAYTTSSLQPVTAPYPRQAVVVTNPHIPKSVPVDLSDFGKEPPKVGDQNAPSLRVITFGTQV